MKGAGKPPPGRTQRRILELTPVVAATVRARAGSSRSASGATAERRVINHRPDRFHSSEADSSVARVPDDVLYLVSLQLLAETEWARKGVCLHTIMNICRRWTAIVSSMPRLWTELSSAWLKLSPAVIARSAALPIAVECVDQHLDRKTMENIYASSSRVRSLTLRLWSANHMQDTLDFLENAGPLPVMETLSLSLPESQRLHIRFPGPFLSTCGRLETVVLENVIFQACDVIDAAPPLLHIRHLRVTYAATVFGLFVVAKFLSSFPNLRTVHYASPSNTGQGRPFRCSKPKNPVSLPLLERLTLMESGDSESLVHRFATDFNLLCLPQECTVQYVFHSKTHPRYLFDNHDAPYDVVAASLEQSTSGISATLTKAGSSKPAVKTLVFTEMFEKDETNTMPAFDRCAFAVFLARLFEGSVRSSLTSMTISGPIIEPVISMLLKDCTEGSRPHLLQSFKELTISRVNGTSWLLFNLWGMLERRHRSGLMLEELKISALLTGDSTKATDLLAKMKKIVGRLTVASPTESQFRSCLPSV